MSREFDAHAMFRTVEALQMEGVVDLDKRRKALALDELGEIENAFQVPILGQATSTAKWQSTDIDFSVEFYIAQLQRDSPLTMPQMTYGAFLSTAKADSVAGPNGSSEIGGEGVVVTASVSSWKTAENGATENVVVGATVAIGVFSGEPGVSYDFDGYLHITFQGYGAPSENAYDNVADLDVGT